MKTTLEGRVAIILGIECAPGRAAAQQLSRAGCRVLLASTDHEAVERQVADLIRKKGHPDPVLLPADEEDWNTELRRSRDANGHVHLVVNAWALATGPARNQEDATRQSALLNRLAVELLATRGPLKIATLWPEEWPDPATPSAAAALWHSLVVLGPRVVSDGLDHIPAKAETLRPAAIADSLVSLFLMPPSACPRRMNLSAIAEG